MRQIPLDFSYRAALGREDFLVSTPNEQAVAWIDRWSDWPGPFLLLVGPRGCGKTHLAHVWAAKSNAVLISAGDLERLDINELTALADNNLVLEDLGTGISEDNLFHLYNLIRMSGNFLLMSSQQPVSGWNIQLPDLASRLGAIQIVRIDEPDDMLFSSILLKLFADRQIQVTPDVIQYLIMRLERSFEEALRIVTALDGLSLAEKRKITIPFVRSLLERKS